MFNIPPFSKANLVQIRSLAIPLVLACSYFSPNVYADSFDELKTSLASLTETSQVSGRITLSVDETRGEKDDDDFEQNSGYISSYINYGKNGLAITYDADIMSQLETEFELVAEDEEAKTPTLKGLNELRTRDVTAILSQSQRLLKMLKTAEFVSEKQVEYKGQQVRELQFKLALDSIINDQRTRDYVDKFNSDYRVIIDDNGFPMASTLTYSGKGRAYIVFSLKASGERHDEYRVIGNRLVNISSHNKSNYDSTFGIGSVETQRFFDASQKSVSQPH
ncbi:hypothetical protein KO525_00850 [Psychrosphaera sp. B3R10]|uniref:hypothetical protein n=1 Tax=unclassified Psychrosphaera TaxID=2641570 RepID=UPI001C08D210|nr:MULTISPECIES: hypothetical protein [unclassified Psychrosphaera]MBU2883763.1 hypothetical protein [Psychrosphaera sp. I2R16]MBU2987935.1 hypothetical protein [Psychrosphaera sp. B3R10]MDO6720418.1 hypothetical protein [Psychrosphaera sp. 1_MG-2023]